MQSITIFANIIIKSCLGHVVGLLAGHQIKPDALCIGKNKDMSSPSRIETNVLIVSHTDSLPNFFYFAK